jgi:hypothetical protein
VVNFRIKAADAGAAEAIREKMVTEKEAFQTSLSEQLTKEYDGVKVKSVDVAPPKVVTEIQVKVPEADETNVGVIVGAALGGCLAGLLALFACYKIREAKMGNEKKVVQFAESPASPSHAAAAAGTGAGPDGGAGYNQMQQPAPASPMEVPQQRGPATWSGAVYATSPSDENGATVELRVESNTTVAEVLQAATAKGLKGNVVSFEGKKLDASASLDTCGVQKESHLQVETVESV